VQAAVGADADQVDRPRGTAKVLPACDARPCPRQIRTFITRASLHKNTVGLLALGHNQGAANYANVAVDNRAPTAVRRGS